MTPIEARNACHQLAAEIGAQAEITLIISKGGEAVSALVRPRPWPHDADNFWARDNTFEGAISKVRAEWSKRAEGAVTATIRRMALAIIDKADGGTVTDTALSADFNAGEIAKHGDAACAEATRLAGNAPFTIQRAGFEVLRSA